jgi:glycosyltransferase involved in cell wall biosynthesis
VVIPSFNHERYVGPAIDSVLAQEGLNVRVLVVDDRSSDGTVAAARSRRDPRVTVRVNRRNLGLGESLHRALKRVRTPFVAVLNSDDLFHPQRLEKCLALFAKHPTAMVAATLLAPVDGDGRARTAADSSPIFDGKKVADWLRWFATVDRPRDLDREVLGQLLEGNFLISSSNLVCRRDWLLDHAASWRDLDYCVDWQIFLLAAVEGALRVVAEPLLAYRLHASNTVWFDEEANWRFYVESHRVVARALEALVARERGSAGRRFKRVLAAVAGPLAKNGAIDWAGVYLGMLLERLAIPPRAIRGDESRAWFKSLEKLRDARVHARDVLQTLGDDLPALLRMRGEAPYLRADRNRLEAVSDELTRMRFDLQHAVQERRHAERLWHSAELDRDREVADKTHLYQQIGAIEGEVDRVRREGEARAEQLAAEVAQARAALDATRARARADLDAERADTLDRIESERRRLLGLMADERTRNEALLSGERDAHEKALAAAVAKHAAQAAALTRRHDDAVERARDQLERLEAMARKADAEVKSLRDLVNQRTHERDEMTRTPEYRVGDVVVNKLRLKRPLRAVETRLHKSKIVAANALLRAERRGLIHSSKGQPRVFATVCWNFPIYSQTFVYQELLQLKQRGFDLRLIYSKLDPHDHLNANFEPLWKLKRTMHLDRTVHERDWMLYKARFPERVEEVTRRLCEASGLSREALTHHANFLQGFSYARLAESWGADYLHSYFFYDRSLMSLIAGQVLNRPRGVSCYADHLLKDYELKVVPLHLQTCDIVVATSHRIKRELLALAPDTHADKILVKPNAVDCNRFPVIPRAEPAAGQPFRIVVTSRIEPKKGLIYLVEAVKLLRDQGVDVECHLVGDADKGVPASENCKSELVEFVARHQLAGKVHLEGRQNEQGVRRFLAISQLFVAPFVETESGDKDGIPTALVEALATGLPSVVTDAGSMLEVVDDRIEARVVRQRDPRGLAEAIRELLADPALRQGMARKAAQRAREQYDVAVCEPRFHERVRKVLSDRKG